MRIALVVHQFFPEHFYGTEVLTLNFARCLQAMGHAVLVVTGCPWRGIGLGDPAVERYVFDGIEVRRLVRAGQVPAGRARISRQWSESELEAPFARILDEFAPEIVHFFHLQNLSVSLLGVASRYAPTFLTATDFWLVCPLTLMRLTDGSTCHGPAPDSANCIKHYAELSSGALGKLVRAMPVFAVSAGLRLASVPGSELVTRIREARALQQRPAAISKAVATVTRIFVPTEFMSTVLTRAGVPDEKIIRMPYGIDLGPCEVRSPILHHAPTVRFGFIGSMSEHKGAHVLISAFRKLPRDLSAVLSVYGASPDTSYTRRLRALAGDDPRIVFRPTFAPEEIGAVMNEIDCLVIPSLWPENAPLVALSARAAGRAIVASDVPGLSEAVPAAELFPEGDIYELARKLRTLVERPTLLCEQLVRAPPAKSAAQMMNEILAYYRRELGREGN
jgi:glycosyltransferase involved in cell wall biosynthesis